MQFSLIAFTLISVVAALSIYAVTFSIYKRPQANKPFIFPFIALLVYVAITLLMAVYASKMFATFVVGPIYFISIFAYPIFSSALMVRRAPAVGGKRRLMFALGVISSIVYVTIFLLLLMARKHGLTEA